METVVYADVLFFINFFIDALCLAATTIILGRKPKIWRMFIASLIGGLYAVIAIYFINSPSIVSVFIHLTAAFVICLVAYKWQGAKKWAANTICFFFISALLGGVLYAIYSICGKFVMYNGAFYAELSAPALIATSAVAVAILIFCLVKSKTRVRSKYADLRVVYRKKECLAHCLCDSGNMLICPYTALPVAVISLNVASDLFNDEEKSALLQHTVFSGIRFLPVSGIGGEALLPSFVPDKAEIKAFGAKRFEEVRLCVAIRLSEEDFGTYDGIIPICFV